VICPLPDAHVPFHVLASEPRKSTHTITPVAGALRVASTTRRTTPQGHSALASPKPTGVDHLHKPTKSSADALLDHVGWALFPTMFRFPQAQMHDLVFGGTSARNLF
jgi:hypothetical protein